MKLIEAYQILQRDQVLEGSSSFRGDFERPPIIPGRAFDKAGDVAVDGGEAGPSLPSRAASTLSTCQIQFIFTKTRKLPKSVGASFMIFVLLPLCWWSTSST